MATVSDQPATDKITLAEAFTRFGVPIATLRYWLDKSELDRDYDDQQRVVVRVDQLEERIAKSDRKYPKP